MPVCLPEKWESCKSQPKTKLLGRGYGTPHPLKAHWDRDANWLPAPWLATVCKSPGLPTRDACGVTLNPWASEAELHCLKMPGKRLFFHLQAAFPAQGLGFGTHKRSLAPVL